MKLDEFHVAELGAGAEGDRVAVGGGDLGVGRLAIKPPRPAGREDRLLGPDEGLAVVRVPDQRPAARPSCVNRSMVKVVSQMTTLGRERTRSDHGPHHFFSGGIPQGVHDAAMAVAPFLREGDFAVVRVEIGPVGDQFANRSGASRTTMSTISGSQSPFPAAIVSAA